MAAFPYDEEIELFNEYKATGNTAIRDKIVEHYVYVAEIIAKRFMKNRRGYDNGMDYDDIYQVACLGLILATDRFDPERGVRFVSFATPTIVGEVRRYFRDKGFVMKVPTRLYEIFRRAERIKRTEGTSDEEEMARILGVSESTVREAYKTGDAAFMKSIESELIGDDDSIALIDTLGKEDKNFLIIENSNFIDYCAKLLTPDERRFVELRYYEEKTQRDVGRIMNMSQVQVSRMERRVLKRLRDIYFGD